MAIRPFKMPDDIPTLLNLLPPSFQYPENPDWNIANDEVEGMMDTLKTIKRLWPLFAAAMLFIPKLRDTLLGFIWEEDGQAVAVSNTGRQGMSDTWFIGNVGVLPGYRRRGIARKVVEACVALARERGAKTVVLDVIAGNLPAYVLYEKLGFEPYGGQSELFYEKDLIPPECLLPDGFSVSPLDRFDWRLRYDFANRITPSIVRKYDPVTEARFRLPGVVYYIDWLIRTLSRLEVEGFVIRNTTNQQVVGTMRYSARKKRGGVNSIGISLDPAYGQLAPFMVAQMLRTVLQASPGHRISMECPAWQSPALESALAAGFTTKYEYKKMGMMT